MSGLEEEFPGRVEAQNVDAKTPQAMTMVEHLGFQSHGLVIHSAEGEVLWSQPDHRVDMEQVRAAIREILEGDERG